jgi:glycosyltransferase involved in cell wall biosynthesis
VGDVPLVSVVIPAHNECESLPTLVPQVISVLSRWPHEIVIVDDGSSDTTWKQIQDLRSRCAAIRGIRFTRNFGHQAALAAGLRAASGAAVITMDADGQHPPALLEQFLQSWQRGRRIVQGVRMESATETWAKRMTSRLFYRIWSLLSGVAIVRGTADFRLLDRAALDTVLASGGSLMFLRGLVPWLGYDMEYVPFEPKARLAGSPAYTVRRMLTFSIDGVIAFSVVPLRLAMALGVTMSALSFLYLCYIVLVFFLSSRVVSGWASTAGLVALVGGIQLFTMGVLGEYVGRIFLRTTDRPQFIVAEQI